jgi:hypothetical protein
MLPTTYTDLKRFEAMVAQLPPAEMVLEHYFIPGVYIRKLSMKAQTVLVGKIHATVHGCIVAKGRIAVGRTEFVAGDVFVSEPGAKRAGYAIEDTVFINVHANPDDETDLAVLEARLITPEMIGYEETVCLG